MFSRAFRSSLKPIELGRRLVREMDAHRTLDVHGRAIVPNVFHFRLSPADHHAFSAIEAPLVRELVDAAKEHARDEGYGFLGPLRVELIADETLRSGRVALASELSAQSRPASGVAPAPAPVVVPVPVVAPAPAPAPARAADDDAAAVDPPSWAAEALSWGTDIGAATVLGTEGPAAAGPAAAAPAPKPAIPETVVSPAAVPPTVVQAAAPTASLELATGERHDLRPGQTATIGRLPTSTVVVNDPNVSRRHCEVRSAGDAWILVDLGSTNGTRVNGNPVDGEQRLAHGDVVTIGATRLRFEVR